MDGAVGSAVIFGFLLINAFLLNGGGYLWPMWRSSPSGPLSRLEVSTRRPGVSRELVAARHLRDDENPLERDHPVGAPVPITPKVVQ